VRDDVVVTSDPRFRKPEPPLHIDAGDGGDWIKLIAFGRTIDDVIFERDGYDVIPDAPLYVVM
jgi:hypothetical protein